MALPADTVFRVRSGGSDTLCGGGFSTANKGATGVDHSQQDAANHTFTASLSGVGTTTLTDSGSGFANTMLGNLIQITGQGVYCITAFGSSASVTVDRALGTFSGATGYEGGANATIGTPAAIMVSGNTVSLQAGMTATLTTAVTFGGVSADGSWSVVGESGTRPIITCATNSVDLFDTPGSQTAGFMLVKHLDMRHTAATRGDALHAKNALLGTLRVDDCLFDGFRYAVNGRFSGDYAFIRLEMCRCEVKNSTTAGISNDGANRLFDCNIHGNTGCGVETETSDNTAVNNNVFMRTAIRGNTSHGIYLHNNNNSCLMHSCDLSNNGGDGLKMDGGTNKFDVVVADSIVWGNTGTGLNTGTLPAGSLISAYNNAVGGNGTDRSASMPAGDSDVTLTADPHNSSTDAGLNATAGGGAAAKAAAAVGPAISANTAGDIGAVPSGGGTAAGGAVMYHPGMGGGMSS